jgi:hypothetical protein
MCLEHATIYHKILHSRVDRLFQIALRHSRDIALGFQIFDVKSISSVFCQVNIVCIIGSNPRWRSINRTIWFDQMKDYCHVGLY